jgi:MYXO-CTERM domain-containing protein
VGVVAGAKCSYIRLRDDPSATSPVSVTFAEADFDAIGAISSAPPVVSEVPEPATFAMAAVGLAAITVARRRHRSPSWPFGIFVVHETDKR